MQESPLGKAFQQNSAGLIQEAGIVDRFENHVGVATGLLEAQDPETLEDRVALTAELVREEMIDEQTELVEIRPLVPEQVFGEWDEEYEVASRALVNIFKAKHGVRAQTIPDPIQLPTQNPNQASFWQAVGADLTEFKRYHGSPSHLAMVAIAETAHARQILGAQQEFDGSELDKTPLLVMQHVDDSPQPTQLVPAETKLLEAGPSEPIRLD